MGWFTTQFATFFTAPFLFLSAWLGLSGGTAQMPFIPAPTSTSPVACTQEAKECPDGAYVGRTGPDCNFAACPPVATSSRPNPTPAPIPRPTPAPVPAAGIRVDSISPQSGPVGTTVSITGFGFTGDNTVFFGSGAIVNVPISSQIAVACTTDPNCIPGIRQTIQFTVPESVGPYCPPGLMIACPMYLQRITPGTYNVRVENENGTSRTVQFTVTGETPPPASGSISISGIDAPAQLSIGENGTWTVHASISGNTQLHYSVNWGDEALYPMVETNASASVQTSATFTHVYNQAGTYTPTFTVSNDNGESATVSATVTVAPLY